MNRFKKDKNYLLRYCIKTSIVLTLAIIALYFIKGVSLKFSFNSSDLLLVLFSILLCGLPSSVLHNCAHRNVGSLKVNDFIGEFMGTFMLYGYKGFALGHMFHHKYPDNPEYDPHPPRGYSFLYFVISPIEATLNVIERAYYDFHGESEVTKKNIRLQKIFFNLTILLRAAFIFMILGPKLFVLLYLPIYLTNIFVFAHINYATHIENEDDNSEIINLNNNLYYKFVNIVSFGGYYHKSHHLKPRAFNPSKVKVDESKRLITFETPDGSKTPERIPLFAINFINGQGLNTKRV